MSLNTTLTFNKKTKKYQALSENAVPTEMATEANQDISDRLYQLVRQLHEVDKMIMTLHLEGYKNPEIAEITGLKINHVNVKLHRLKNQIIAQLKKA